MRKLERLYLLGVGVFVFACLPYLLQAQWDSDYICGNVQDQIAAVKSITVDEVSPLVLNNTGGCLQIQGASTQNDAEFELGICAPAPQPLQIMTFHQPGGYITVPPSGRCLTVRGANYGDGTVVDQYDCWTAQNQRWGFIYSPDKKSFQVKSIGGNTCLKAGAKGMIVSKCYEPTNPSIPAGQLWNNIAIQPTIGKIVNLWDNSGKLTPQCIHAKWESRYDNADVELTDCKATAQEFKFNMGIKYMLPQAVYWSSSTQALTVIGGMLASGSVVRQFSFMNLANQLWIVVPFPGTDWFQLQNPGSGSCLTAQNSGTFINIWPCVNSVQPGSGQFWSVKAT